MMAEEICAEVRDGGHELDCPDCGATEEQCCEHCIWVPATTYHVQ
jgi:hypothetical protein